MVVATRYTPESAKPSPFVKGSAPCLRISQYAEMKRLIKDNGLF
jgi:hypothetical protein